MRGLLVLTVAGGSVAHATLTPLVVLGIFVWHRPTRQDIERQILCPDAHPIENTNDKRCRGA